jgi:hypothetical protein
MNMTTNAPDMTLKEINRLFQEYRGILKTAQDLFDQALNDPYVPEEEVRLLGRMILLREDIDDIAIFQMAANRASLKG